MYMYPQSNSARSVRDLSGVWDFRFNADEPWQPIAVPASYNDQSPDPEFRRHYGMAYYRTTFTVPEGARRVLRFDAVTHNAVVRLNGQEIASHRGGFLPFEADITALAQPGETVTLDVEVDNRIGHSSLPVGNEGGTAFFGSDNAGIPAVEAGKARQQAQGINLPNFDFFNYAGITRPVHLHDPGGLHPRCDRRRRYDRHAALHGGHRGRGQRQGGDSGRRGPHCGLRRRCRGHRAGGERPPVAALPRHAVSLHGAG